MVFVVSCFVVLCGGCFVLCDVIWVFLLPGVCLMLLVFFFGVGSFWGILVRFGMFFFPCVGLMFFFRCLCSCEVFRCWVRFCVRFAVFDVLYLLVGFCVFGCWFFVIGVFSS